MANHRSIVYRNPSSAKKKVWSASHKNYSVNMKKNSHVDCGWGRLLFAQTYSNAESLIQDLEKERRGERDLAFYAENPHVIVAADPAKVFLDPSHIFRIRFEKYRYPKRTLANVTIRRLETKNDIEEVNQILLSRKMIPLTPERVQQQIRSRTVIHLVAEQVKSRKIVGYVTGVDHMHAFNDPENGSSLWSLAVSSKSAVPGVGESLTRYLTEYFMARGRAYMDLSVLHDNKEAIALYQKLKFQKASGFCVKLKNIINEPLYSGPSRLKKLNPYAQIITDEARRRGISVDIIDQEKAYFRLSWGGKSIVCRESLTELTSATSMSWCSDKQVTSRLLKKAGIKVPDQITYQSTEKAESFLAKHKEIVIKPTEGEQGRGVIVGIKTKKALKESLKDIRETMLLEEYVKGYDTRIIIIDHQFVAAAIRTPPQITGNGKDKIKTIIQKLSRRRASATGGESKIPLDEETLRCIKDQRYDLEDILEKGKVLTVRKTANLHTGGSISDITNQISAKIIAVAEEASRILKIPVVGFDFILPELSGDKYWIIEANERPGLANHEPQPTAQKFMDLLFPFTTPHENFET